MADTLYDELFEGVQRAKEVYRAEAHRLARELEYMKTLAANAVREYPVASGLYRDMDGQAGYGSLKAMRLYLGMAPDNSCRCIACDRDGPHASICAVHNEPALAVGPCDCGSKT